VGTGVSPVYGIRKLVILHIGVGKVPPWNVRLGRQEDKKIPDQWSTAIPRTVFNQKQLVVSWRIPGVERCIG
jgi:hypothetical protein